MAIKASSSHARTLSCVRLATRQGSIASIVVAAPADKLGSSGRVNCVQAVEKPQRRDGAVGEARVNLPLLVARKRAILLLSLGGPYPTACVGDEKW